MLVREDIKKLDWKQYVFMTVLMVIALSWLYGVQWISAEERQSPKSHHFDLVDKPQCTECHTSSDSANMKPIDSFNHSTDFINSHKYYAAQSSNICAVCHKVSFCTDCHANKTGLKPSDRFSGSPERWLPHRGDYLIQHRIDGRIDPASCFRCHARQNNKICRKCHK